MDDISQETDVNTESAPTSDAGSSAPENVEQSQQMTEVQDVSKLPFNDPKSPMHARFKELHDQASEYKGRWSATEDRLQKIEAQYQSELQRMKQEISQYKPAAPKPFQPLLDELKGVHPEFAKLQEQALEAMDQVPSLKQELAALRQERERERAYTELSSLYEKNKVSKDLQPLYEQAVKAKAYETNAGLKDLPGLFNEVHENYSKFFDTYSRNIRSSYVTEKKKDAAPASTTGGTPTGSPKPAPMAREDFIKWAAQELRKDKNNI